MSGMLKAPARLAPTLVLAALFAATLVAWGYQRWSGGVAQSLAEHRTASRMAQDSGPETRAEKQSLALEAVGRILEHHAPAAAAAPSKHPDYWPGISFFAKRREQAWRERKAEEKQNAMKQELREQAPAGPNGQKLSPAQAAIAAKFDALNGGSSKNYDEMRKEYERETGHKLRPSAPAHRGAREWGSTWRLPDARAGPEGREHGSRRQSLEGRGTHEPMTGDEEGPGIETEERYQRPYGNENQVHEEGKEVKLEREIADLKHQLEVRNEAINAPVHEDKTAALEREVHELRKELGGVEEDVRHGWEGGMHIEGGSTRSGGIWDGASRRAVVPTARGGSGLQEVGGEGGEAEEEGGGVATGAPGEKDYDKYGVELDKYKDPVPLHYRDDVAGGVEVHTREDEIRKIHEYQAKIAEEQGKMRDDWKKLMEKPAPVTDATRPDIMDPDSFPTEGAAFRKKYQEMKDFKAAVEAFNHDPEFNPMIVLKAHHLVKYGIPAPESDSIDVWRQWYRETLDKYKVVRHQVTDMASGNWHDYETDWDIHGIHRPGAYKKVWRTRDDWGPGKPHAPLVESPNANFTLVAGGGVAEEGVGGELQNETAAEVAEAEAEAPAGGAAAEAPAEAPSGEASAEAAGAASEAAAVGEGGANEKAPVAALANKVDNLEHKLDQVVNLLEASRGSAVPAATLRSRTQQRLAQQHHNLRKEYLPSAAERDRMARAADARRAGASAAAAGHVSTLVAARKASATQGELKATATAAAMEALGSHAQGASSAEEKILKHPPKAVLSWLASALEAADKKDSSPAAATAVPNRPAQSLVNIHKAPAAPVTARQGPPATPLVFQVKPAAPADRIEKAVRGGASTAAGSHEKMPNAVAQMVQQGTWQGGETVAAAPTTVLKKGPPLYTAADAKKDVAAMASANAAITAAEKVNAPDTVVHAKTSSKSVMQTGPDPSLSAKEAVSTYVDPLKRVTKAILVDAGSAKAKAAQADISQGEVEPEGQRDSAQVPKGLVKKFVGGRTMYVPKYDHAKAGGDGWDWLW